MSDGNKERIKVRVPAEWEDYEAVMLAWPHVGTDWAPMLDEVCECYRKLAKNIIGSGLRLVVVTPDVDGVRVALKNLPSEKIVVFRCQTNDTWTRDYGPISVYDADGSVYVSDFRFDGWGLKFAANHDNLVTLNMISQGLMTRNYLSRLDYTFEGGSMEVDGAGTMLSTSHCLQSLNRNGFKNREQLQDYFAETLGVDRLLLLDHGHLDGDDTDSHIDTLARFAPNDTILYVKAYDRGDSHCAELDLMETELQELRTKDGNAYNLIGLPLPDPIFDEDGERLPATYANFLITPRTVLMPTYAQPDNDRMAKHMLQIAFPDHEIVGVDCRALIKQHGSLHCATMQLPHGVLRV